jgi:hypothetical protein
MKLKEYKWKMLSTDDSAKVKNFINKKMNELENFTFETWPDRLGLKWGWLKYYSFESNPKAQELIQKMYDIWISPSAILQNNTDEQKQILCEIIDITNWCIFNDWDWENYTKEQAKKYVLEC